MEQIRQRVHRDEATWREIFARQAASGLLVSQFCRQEKINPGIFRRWRTVLESSAGQRQASPAHRAKSAAAFVDLGALEARGARFEIRLELGDGVVLNLARG